ncbi:MAG: agmatinase [Candidatus Bathyarchaeota archaeon]|nr:MAG: agmatinase [Candidatus Bathyarchaeota archaeon]
MNVSYHELFISPSPVFTGLQKAFDEAEFVVLGVPFDATSTYRSGAKFAPLAIRDASLNIEMHSFRTNIDAEDLRVHDLGDLDTSNRVDETLERLKLVVGELIQAGKTPAIIGGEHTISLGSVQSVGRNLAIVSFDAHLDLRNEYMGQVLSHSTFMRRLDELVKPPLILEIGTRAVCKEELEYAKKSNIEFLTANQMRIRGIKKAVQAVKKLLADYKEVYVTVDMDVLDPAFAPAVQNPEPDGLDMHMLLEVLSSVCDSRVAAIDLAEVAPHYDNGVTAIQAAKVLVEILCQIKKARKD